MKYDKDFDEHRGLKKSKRFSTVTKDENLKPKFIMKPTDYTFDIHETEFKDKRKILKIEHDKVEKEIDPNKKGVFESFFGSLFDMFDGFLCACVGVEKKKEENKLAI